MITDTTYKVGIYLRLSREDERLGESGSISTQRDLLLNYIRDNNLIFIDEYVDDGVSGTTFDREGFNRMIKDCEEKKINMIITKDTSRGVKEKTVLVRNYKNLLKRLHLRLKRLRIIIFCLHDSKKRLRIFSKAFSSFLLQIYAHIFASVTKSPYLCTRNSEECTLGLIR